MGKRATRSGEVLNDAYQLDELVSDEGHVELYRAIDKRTDAVVLVKLLRPEFALQSELVDSVLRRPRLLCNVAHESLPMVRVDSDETGIPFVVEETVQGRALSDLAETFPQGMPVSLVCQLGLPLVEALALAHRHGLTHGAIDGLHVLLLGATDALRPKLVGLGVDPAHAVQDPAYRAPESGPGETPTAQSDVFALGVLFFKMLSGALPFRAGTLSALALEDLAPQLARPWSQLTAACLRTHPKDRPADAGAVLRSLERCVATSSRPAAPSSRASAAAAATKAALTKPASGAPRASQRASARAGASPATPAGASAPPARPSAQDLASRLSAKYDAANQNSVRPRAERVSPPPAAASPATTSGRAPVQQSPRPPLALTRAQLDSLHALRRHEEQDEERNRWIALLLALLFLLALALGVPLLYDADFGRARVAFGSQLRLGAAALSIVTVAGALRPLIMRLGRRSVLQRLGSLLLQAVACCVVVIVATLYSQAPGLARAASYARVWLPWGMGVLLALFALEHALRGLRHLGRDLVFAALVLGLAGASTCGSYSSVVRAVANEKHRAQKPKPSAAPPAAETPTPGTGTLTAAAGSPAPQPEETQQRNEVGASESEDLRPIEELERARERDKQALDGLGDRLP